MIKKITLTLSTLAIASSMAAFSVPALAGSSANIGVASNYIWRGVTQSADDAAISGGLDHDFGNGFSVGTWASSLGSGNGYELDLYGGYSGEIGAMGYNLGVTHYAYPVGSPDAYFDELGVGVSFGVVEAGVAYTFASDDDTTPEFSDGDLYYSLGASTELKPGLSLAGTVGRYDFDNAAGDDYNHGQVSLSKDDFTFAVDKTTGRVGNNDVRVSVAWTKSFDL